MWFYLIAFWIHNAAWQTQMISNLLRNHQFPNNTSRGILLLVRCLLIMGRRMLFLRFKWSLIWRLVNWLILFNLDIFCSNLLFFNMMIPLNHFMMMAIQLCSWAIRFSWVLAVQYSSLSKCIALVDSIALQHKHLEHFCACSNTKFTAIVFDYAN